MKLTVIGGGGVTFEDYASWRSFGEAPQWHLPLALRFPGVPCWQPQRPLSAASIRPNAGTRGPDVDVRAGGVGEADGVADASAPGAGLLDELVGRIAGVSVSVAARMGVGRAGRCEGAELSRSAPHRSER